MGKKKILLVRNTPYDADFSTYNIQEVGIGKAFCRLGYDYDHVCFKRKNQQTWVFYDKNGCKGRYIEVPRFRFLRWGINLNILKKDFLSSYDIIISREYYQLMTWLFAIRGNNVSMYSGPYYNLFFTNWFSSFYDFFFTESINTKLKGKFVKSVLAKEFMEKKGYSNIVNVGVGLDTERFDNEIVVKKDTQEIVDYMREHKCILYVGALSDRKNLPFLLETYQRVLDKDPDIKFVMIGKSSIGAFQKLIGKKDEDYERECLSKISPEVKAGLYRVQRIDNAQLKFIYPLAKAFLLPSKLEIFGMVLLEALYLGAPVITSCNGGSMTIIDGKNTGIIIDEFDSKAWSNAVLDLVKNPEKTKEMVNNGVRIVKELYSWDAIAKRMIEEIEKAK